MPRRAPGAFAALGCALLAFAEGQAWGASRAGYPPAAACTTGPAAGRDVVLILGYPGRRDGTPGLLQRWRVRIARRSAPVGAVFVFTGGAVGRDVAEADTMAAYGARLGIRPSDIVIERAATTTRENLSLSLPWLAAARTIRIASNTAHAHRSRRYLRELDPTLWRRLRRTRDFVPLELGPLRLALTFYDFVAGRVSITRERRLSSPSR